MKKIIKNAFSIVNPVLIFILILISTVVLIYFTKNIYILFTIINCRNKGININYIELMNINAFDKFHDLYIFIYYILCIVIFLLWYLHIKKNKNCHLKKWNLSMKDLLLLIIMYICIYVISDSICNLFYYIMPNVYQSFADLINKMMKGNRIVVYTQMILFAPVAEELMYRGVIMEKAKKIMPFFWANLIQALLFGALHMNLVQSSYAFLSGLLFGYVVHKYNTILASIILHMLNNATGAIMELAKIELSPFAINIGAILSILILFLIIKKMNKEDGIFNSKETGIIG